MEYQLTGPFTKDKLKVLRAGDTVLITGALYTARDAAHKRLTEAIEQQEPLPFKLRDSILYYVGPTPEKPGRPIGSAGPTTSYRMDAYTPALLNLGQAAMIGKGPRSREVKEALLKNGAVYFAAVGGAGALLARRVESAGIIAFKDLGAEAIRELQVKDFPVTVVIDTEGNDLYLQGRSQYLKENRCVR